MKHLYKSQNKEDNRGGYMGLTEIWLYQRIATLQIRTGIRDSVDIRHQ